MAEIETVESTMPKEPLPSNKRDPLHGMSPLQIGLLYGGTASVAGPLGILVGLGAGIIASRYKKNYMEQTAAYTNQLDREYQDASDNINSEKEIADPAEKRMLTVGQRMMRDGYERMRSGIPGGQELWDKGNALMQGVISGDIQDEKNKAAQLANLNQGLVQGQAAALRNEYQQSISGFEQISTESDKVLNLTNQPDFDPNKPFYKAALSGLIASSLTSFYRDTPNVTSELLQGVGGVLTSIPNIYSMAGGAAAGILSNVLNAKDSQVTREDYNRIALNALAVAKRHTQTRMDRIRGQTGVLDQFAKHNNVVPGEYSFEDYVTGAVKDIALIPVPAVKAPQKVAPPAPQQQGVAPWLQSLGKKMRPTNE